MDLRDNIVQSAKSSFVFFFSLAMIPLTSDIPFLSA